MENNEIAATVLHQRETFPWKLFEEKCPGVYFYHGMSFTDNVAEVKSTGAGYSLPHHDEHIFQGYSNFAQ